MSFDGMVTFAAVKEFQEKPSLEEAKSTLINTGIYIFNYKRLQIDKKDDMIYDAY